MDLTRIGWGTWTLHSQLSSLKNSMKSVHHDRKWFENCSSQLDHCKRLADQSVSSGTRGAKDRITILPSTSVMINGYSLFEGCRGVPYFLRSWPVWLS